MALSGLRRDAVKKSFVNLPEKLSCPFSRALRAAWKLKENGLSSERSFRVYERKKIPLRSNHSDEPLESTRPMILHHLPLRQDVDHLSHARSTLIKRFCTGRGISRIHDTNIGIRLDSKLTAKHLKLQIFYNY